MTREEANAKIAELVAAAKAALEHANKLCELHGLNYDMEVVSENDSYRYTTHFEMDRFGNQSAWTSSTWVDSGCSDVDWDSSDC